ncbi:MAG: ribulose-phosphate 3-epimerase [Candidatus Gastranaerophilales bacterium]|nr:ribulose-phosphate 3-epimerase [Candidatus Gastranaerophilales bacterium]
MDKKILIAPSILSADFANLEQEIKKVEKAGADFIHIDVMDGHFVPNITIGAPVVKAIKKITALPLDVHLMIASPEKFLDDFINAGADILTIHYETVTNPKELLQYIRSKNIKAGISVKPQTLPEVLDGLYDYLDLILVMTVEPGFGGQSFIEECAPKINYYSKNTSVEFIEVDGGINYETAKICVNNGANVLVAGNYIYKSDDIENAMKLLKNID